MGGTDEENKDGGGYGNRDGGEDGSGDGDESR